MVDAHSSPAFAEQGRIAVDRHQPVLPAEEPPDFRALQLRGHLPVARARTRPVGVEPVVPDLVELPVRDVDEEACDEPGDGIRHVLPPPLLPFLQPVVLVRVVVPGHGPCLLVEAVDSPFADRRMGGVSCDVSREHREVCQPVRLPSRAVHVEAVRVLSLRTAGLQPEGALLVRRVLPEPFFPSGEELVPESLPHRLEGEVGDMVQLPVVRGIALRDQHMEMRMPFQVSSERVEERYEPELPFFSLPCQGRASEQGLAERLPHGFEQHVQPAPVFPEPGPEPLRNGEDELPVRDVVELLLDRCGYPVAVLLPAGGTEPRLAREADDGVVVAFRAFRYPVPVFQLAAFQRLLHVLDDRRPGQLGCVLLLEVRPALLDDVHDPDLPPLSPCLQGVAEHAYEIGEDGVPRVSCSAKPVMELALLEIGLLREVRMRVMAPLHADILASGIRKRLALRLATR